MLLRIITVFNWLVIAFLAFFFILDLIEPKKGGGDAAGKGIGDALVFLVRALLVALIILNLIPHPIAKYAAFALIIIPPLAIWGTPKYRNFQQILRMKMEAARPLFEDKNLNALARAVQKGDPQKFQQLLEKNTLTAEQRGELLSFSMLEANGAYKPEEKLQCLRLMLDAGFTLESMGSGYEMMHFHPAYSGNLPLLRFLLEKGLDANAVNPDSERSILFETVECYQNPEAAIRLLLEFGARPNVTAVREPEDGPISPLVHAAKWDRWGICAALLEHGADPNFVSEKGVSFKKLYEEADKNFQGDGYTTRADFERVKRLMEK
ncbi:MAG: ankyrin repeat domain-containing protein [Saprospiraceae bacterium]|nr:ankyrin repeat domain-containing protein [Saprospiraceae bacterium]